MTTPRITIVTFAWPPRNSIAAHRPYNWAKYWSAAGAQVRVLTARKYSYDAPLDLELPPIPNVQVIETEYQSTTGLGARLLSGTPFEKPARKALRWLRRSGHGQAAHPRAGWLRAIRPKLPELAQECDLLISTFDPVETHLIAAEMKAANPGIFWTADYRDLWSQNHLAEWTKEERAKQQKLEVETLSQADLLTSVSDDLCAQLSALHHTPSEKITNGFDVDRDTLAKALSRPAHRPKAAPLKIVYTGKIYPEHRDPTPLFEAVEAMEQAGEISEGSVQIHIYGGQAQVFADAAQTRRFSHMVKEHGHVARDVAMEAQRNADLLLLLESPAPEARGVLTGKLFEYMATGVPILSLGSRKDSEIAQVLDQTGCGICAESNQTVIRQTVLNRISEIDAPWFQPNLQEILKYSREAQAGRLLEFMRKGHRAL